VGRSLSVAFAHAGLDEVRAAVASVLAAREAAVGGFAGAGPWTCLLTAPKDVLTADGGAALGLLSRALRGEEVWALDVRGDSMRVMRAVDGQVARAGYTTDELDAGREFDPTMTMPILAEVTIASACALARPRDARVVEQLARGDVADVAAAAAAIAAVFGGARAKLIDDQIAIDWLVRRTRPMPVQPSFALFTKR
jgi:hypothetical protein